MELLALFRLESADADVPRERGVIRGLRMAVDYLDSMRKAKDQED